jgi:hypothetical protein
MVCLCRGDVPDTTEDIMLTRTSLFAFALLLATAPAFAQAVSGMPASPSGPGAQGASGRSAVLAPPVAGSVQPASPAAIGTAKPATAERQGSAPRPAQDGKVAAQPAQPVQPTRAN